MKKLFIVYAALYLTSCNSTDHGGHASGSKQTDSAHANHSDQSESSNPMQAEMDKMMTGMMAMDLSGDPDRDFALLMKAHHQAAVDMANLQLQQGKDTAIRAFAQQVVADQSKEIDAFNKVLQKANTTGKDQALSDSMMQAMHQYMEPHQPLKNDIDHDFLALMIPHHQSAVVMTQIYLQKGKDQGLRRLGNIIIQNQNKEIEQMKGWLGSR